MSFQTRLVALRHEKSISQDNIASALGITQATVSSWELGKQDASMELAKKLAAFFNVSLDYLLDISDEDSTEIGKELSAFHRKYDGSDSAGKKYMMTILKTATRSEFGEE